METLFHFNLVKTDALNFTLALGSLDYSVCGVRILESSQTCSDEDLISIDYWHT